MLAQEAKAKAEELLPMESEFAQANMRENEFGLAILTRLPPKVGCFCLGWLLLGGTMKSSKSPAKVVGIKRNDSPVREQVSKCLQR